VTAAEVTMAGISVLGGIPWGTHLCHFYETKQDLLDILLPYFKAGLENGELCVWVVAEPFTVEEARDALRLGLGEAEHDLSAGDIEIIPHTGWYLKDGSFANRGQGSGLTGIAGACTLLGESGVRNLAARACVYSPAADRTGQFREHSQRSAVAARLLSELTGILEPASAYAVGLLHNVGEALLSSLFPEEMERFTWLETGAQLEHEVAAFGVDHAQVGQAAAPITPPGAFGGEQADE
jgi:MEDS: MEthanogen/methylotroph, DcmR Sensory domain/HDOD domain